MKLTLWTFRILTSDVPVFPSMYILSSILQQGNTGRKLFYINPFPGTGLILYPLKTSEDQRFSDIFRRYRKKPVAYNGLNRNIGSKMY